MKFNRAGILAGLLLGATAPAFALSAGDQYVLGQIQSGSASALRDAAKSVFSAGAADPAVLDALAEALLTRMGNGEPTNLDALAWTCKALGNTHNGRYYEVLQKAAASPEAKMQRHCVKAAAEIPSAQGAQYSQGSAKAAAPVAAAAPAKAKAGGKGFAAVTVGMSQEEAYAIAGQPTSVGGHVTGKAFIPFNFKGGDTYRLIAHYKGQGRIVFSKTNRYTSTLTVLEVQVDPGSTGYP